MDIDVSDYADIWALGRQSDEDGGGALTRAEWPLMVASVKTLQTLLSGLGISAPCALQFSHVSNRECP